jgi:PPP family 3-phenylpropionic acid transporter
MRKTQYSRLSAFYFFYFAALGAFLPYWALYLKSLNFNANEIGELLAIVMVSKVASPYLFSWISDHIQKRLVIIQASMFVSVVVFAGVIPFQSYWWFAFVMVAFGFFWNAALPLYEALTLNHLEHDTSLYSSIRLWGSVGFIVVALVLPLIIGGSHISLLPLIILALLIANTVTTFLVDDRTPKSSHQSSQTHIIETLKKPIVLAFLFACFFQSLSHGAYYTFFTIYLEDHGYSRGFSGAMWALGVLAEVGLFIVMRRLLTKFSVCHLFAMALFITAIRWVMLALYVDSIVLLFISQLLHAASFGLFHACSIYLAHSLFPGRLQGRGQALYAGVSFGLGGTLGHLLSGYAWDSQGAIWTFLSSAIIALIGAIIASKYITKERLSGYANKT